MIHQSWWEDSVNERKEKLVIQRKQREWKLKLADGSKVGKASGSVVKQERAACVQAAERPPCTLSLKLTVSPLVSPAYHQRQVTVHLSCLDLGPLHHPPLKGTKAIPQRTVCTEL